MRFSIKGFMWLDEANDLVLPKAAGRFAPMSVEY